jgi:hypothetical protein
VDLGMRYAPLRRMKLYSKKSARFPRCGLQHKIWLCPWGNSARFCYVLWAIAQDFVMCYGPYNAGFGYALWTIGQTNYLGAEPHHLFLKLAISLKRL